MTTDILWSEIERYDGCLPLRWRQKSSHVLSFEFLDVQDEEIDFTVDVKWDGCINWETSPDCMAHFCDLTDADRLALTFRKAWSITKAKLLTADVRFFEGVE